jgi:hypothetical protein
MNFNGVATQTEMVNLFFFFFLIKGAVASADGSALAKIGSTVSVFLSTCVAWGG